MPRKGGRRARGRGGVILYLAGIQTHTGAGSKLTSEADKSLIRIETSFPSTCSDLLFSALLVFQS